MTSSRELETRHYWRTMQALKEQEQAGATSDEMHDELDELDMLSTRTSSARLRALCLNVLASGSAAVESTA